MQHAFIVTNVFPLAYLSFPSCRLHITVLFFLPCLVLIPIWLVTSCLREKEPNKTLTHNHSNSAFNTLVCVRILLKLQPFPELVVHTRGLVVSSSRTGKFNPSLKSSNLESLLRLVLNLSNFEVSTRPTSLPRCLLVSSFWTEMKSHPANSSDFEALLF